MDNFISALDPKIAACVVFVLGILSAVKGLLNAFGNQENKFVVILGKVLDFVGFNPKH